MSRQSIAYPPAQRNRDLLLRALRAGQCVISETIEGAPLVPSRSDPTVWYKVTRRHTLGAPNLATILETCECQAMQGAAGADTYHREVARWKNRAGVWETNGVLPCGHILIARFDDQWQTATDAGRRALLAAVPGLADALSAGGQYSLPTEEAQDGNGT